jgi:imidazoleglycerol phosphate dehydratase HisB
MCQMVARYVGLETASQNIVLSVRLDVHGQNSLNTGLFFYANLIRLECLQYGL